MNAQKRKELKAKAHALNPVVILGQSGLTDAVMAEIELALDCHELIKVKIRAERDERRKISDDLVRATGAVFIQAIGQVLVLYRLKQDK